MYTPPSPFDIVLSDNAILKYSELFTRLLGMFQAQEALERISQTEKWKSLKSVSRDNGEACIITEFLHVAHIFLSSLQNYVFLTAINKPWKEFMDRLDELAMKSSIMKLGMKGDHTNLESLGKAHDKCLDEIFWRLFSLYEEQKIVQNHIEKLCSILVSFSRSMQGRSKQSIPQLFFSFQSTHQSFLRLLKDVVVKEEFCGVRYPNEFSHFYELYYSISGLVLI